MGKQRNRSLQGSPNGHWVLSYAYINVWARSISRSHCRQSRSSSRERICRSSACSITAAGRMSTSQHRSPCSATAAIRVVDALEGCAAAKLYMIDHDGLSAREVELNQAVVARGDNLRRVAGALDGVDVLPAAGASVLDLAPGPRSAATAAAARPRRESRPRLRVASRAS